MQGAGFAVLGCTSVMMFFLILGDVSPYSKKKTEKNPSVALFGVQLLTSMTLHCMPGGHSAGSLNWRTKCQGF